MSRRRATLGRRDVCWRLRRTLARASSPKFFQAATQADFLKGDVENLSIDGRGQLTLGPGNRAGVRDAVAVSVDRDARAGRIAFHRHRQRRPRVPRRCRRAKARRSSTRRNSRSTRCAPAPNGGIYVGDVARRQDLQGRSQRRVHDVLRSGGEVHLGAGCRRARATSTPAPAKKASSTRSRPTARARRSIRRRRRTRRRWRSTSRATCSSAPSRRDACSASTPTARASSCSTRRSRKSARCGSTTRACCTSRPSTAAPRAALRRRCRPIRRSERRPPTRVPRARAVGVGVDRNHRGRRRRQPPGSSGPSASRADDRRPRARSTASRPTASGISCGNRAKISPYDVAFDADGPSDRRDREQGQDLPARRAIRCSRCCWRERRAQQVTALYRDQRGRLYYATANPGQTVSRLSPTRATRGTYESEVRDAQMVSSWGSISWRGTATPGNRDRDLDAVGQHRNARRHVERVVINLYDRGRLADHQPEGAVPAVARDVLSGTGEGPILTSVTAAYLQRNLRPTVRSITVHPPGIVFQKPYSTGDPDLAGFDNQTTPDRKLAQAAQSAQGASRSLGRRTYQKGLQTIVWRADDENDDELSYDVLVPPGRRRGRGMRFGEISPTRYSCGTRRPCQTARISSRSSRRTPRRIQPPQRCRVSSRASRSKSTTHRPRSSSAACALTAIAPSSCST